MWKSPRLRPILVSVLVVAASLAHTIAGTGVGEGDGYCSPYNYASSARLTLVNYSGAALANFPAYLVISEKLISGFHFSDVKNGTDDIVFFDSTGRVLDYELDGNWRPTATGETRLWIKIPAFRTGEVITMCWNLRDGCTPPSPVTPERVWSDYVGVWHMDETLTAATAPTTPSRDATGNGRDIVPNGGTEKDFSAMTSAAGVFSNARVNDTVARKKKNANYLEISKSSSLAFDGTFTLSFWLKIDDYQNWPQIASRRAGDGTHTGFQIDLNSSDRKKIIARGGSQTGNYNQVVDKNFKDMGYVHLAFVYNGPKVSVYSDGVLRVDEMSIDEATDNDQPIVFGNQNGGTDQSVYGKYDEIRLYRGVKSADWVATEHAMTPNNKFWSYGAVSNDVNAVLKNAWKTEPSATRTTWDADNPDDRPTIDDFNLGVPGHGTSVITFYNKATGAVLGDVVPQAPGEYRAVITVDVSRDGGVWWGALEYVIDFRIIRNTGRPDLGVNVDRVLLLNDDYATEGGEVMWQAYGDEPGTSTTRYWRHLDADGRDASTAAYGEYWSVSPDFNLGGGTHHQYFTLENNVPVRLWDLKSVRFGNTFNNGEDLPPETWSQGLAGDQNYLPWNPESQRSPLDDGEAVGPYHRYASHIVMQNAADAAVTSPMYTNGIGTVYFDAVNGWADNVRGEDGAPNYELVVEVATNCTDSTLPPTDRNVSSNPDSANPYDPFLYADWRRVDVRVLRFGGDTCTDLGVSSSAVLDVEAGGSYTNFYRVIAPIGVQGNVRFRIRRTAIDREQSLSPDGQAYILVDNVICSTPPDYVNLEPYGRYDGEKKGHEVQGWGGAFIPAFPSSEEEIRGRAKATMASGRAVPEGSVSSATMHYRWHYINQKTTPWRLADLDPSTLVTHAPLSLPTDPGDIEFWFDLSQVGNHYEYVDYSGRGVGLGKSGYSEAIVSVTNRAPNHASAGDWYVRTREGRSHCSEIVLVAKTSMGATERTIPLSVVDNNIWRGYYPMTEESEDGIWWHIEVRDKQEDGAAAWNYGTNWWYVTDWAATPPTHFPVSEKMAACRKTDWCRMSCDGATGHLMFQVNEETRNVTVLHADYQNFNDWNAANEYFSGSSEEPDQRIGASGLITTYNQLYRLSDTPATDDLWRFYITSQIGQGGYEGYRTFAGKDGVLVGWNVGKGMWVHGRYREPSSRVAYQAAGCGEGRAEFARPSTVARDRWPRGVGSVSLKARLAQAISPSYLSYRDDSSRLTNYTVMARGCFDMKKNEGFAGNAALSLFGYYRSDKGAYEVRWEQIKGEQTTNPNYPPAYLGPKNPGQRLVISRWEATGNGFRETELIAVTNGVDETWSFKMPVMDGSAKTNNLLPICMSVYHTERNGPTYIVAGVRATAESAGTLTGVSPDSTIPSPLPVGASTDRNWYFVTYRDTSANRLDRGAYGFLTSNCEGMLLRPQYMPQPAWPSDVSSAGDVMNDKFAKNALAVTASVPSFAETRDEIADDWWVMYASRMRAYIDPSGKTGYYGFTHVAEPQMVEIYTAKHATGTWDETPIARIPVTDFGTPYNQADVSTNLYYTDDCDVRVVTGGGLDDPRRDVVLDDIVVSQWRGTDWWSTYTVDWDVTKDEPFDGSSNGFGNTNIVFTSGWIVDQAVRLSAKRTQVDYAASVRSPLFDGRAQGTGDSRIYRGVGLGQIGFRYRKPTRNIRLKVQVCTNYLEGTSWEWVRDISRSVKDTDEGFGRAYWQTLRTLNYDDLTDATCWDEEKGEGAWTLHLGWHGVKGMMRVAIDNDLTKEVKNESKPSLFGEIDILEVTCKDEPALDRSCWWGWNVKTVGDATDSVRRMFLADYSPYLQFLGQSMAINNSLTEGTDPRVDPADFTKHPPFVQTPAFENPIVGQITFKARKYDISDRAPSGKVVVYGASRNPDEIEDGDWTRLGEFAIDSSIYKTYTCRVENQRFYALRIVVPMDEGEPQRVLLDEVAASESATARLAFRKVGAFRSNLKESVCVPNMPSSGEQPLCDENWGIQAEVYASMLADEIDASYTPQVTLHWFVGDKPWGYENWKGRSDAGHAALAQAKDDASVYRSSYDLAAGAIMAPQTDPGKVVQYMLEVEYRAKHVERGVETIAILTNFLDAATWPTPEWYAPVDYNADAAHGAGKTFAGYTILDRIAPGWAWVNEVNVYGGKNAMGGNVDEEFQYAEVCVPAEADMKGWELRMLEAYLGEDRVRTNTVAVFGNPGIPTKKKDYVGLASNMVFLCLGNKKSDKLKTTNGTLDALWGFRDWEGSSVFDKRDSDSMYYIKSVEMPFGVQLVRPSGIIEHSVVVVGTNRWGRLPGRSIYDPDNIAAQLNRNVPGSRFFYAAEDNRGAGRSGSVTDGQGEDKTKWTNDWLCSPGYVNTNGQGQVQQIKEHPTPHGATVLVYASVDRTTGPIRQFVGGKDSSVSNDFEIIILPRESKTGTNILYRVEPWYEVGGVTVDGQPAWQPGAQPTNELNFVFGKGATTNITVRATARIDRHLSEQHGMTADNPYTPAVMDWLRGGRTRDREFANNGTIALANFVDKNDTVITNMPLLAMYWLDMDPTLSDQVLKGYVYDIQTVDRQIEGEDVVNRLVTVFLMISNRNNVAYAPYAPYMLRGIEPKSTSLDYLGTAREAWTSETFKVTGFLYNKQTDSKDYYAWQPLRWFVFHDDSFYAPGNSEGKPPFTTEVEIIDPKSRFSTPGRDAGWYKWCNDPAHPERADDQIWHKWTIDPRLRPVGVEVLKPSNRYE